MTNAAVASTPCGLVCVVSLLAGCAEDTYYQAVVAEAGLGMSVHEIARERERSWLRVRVDSAGATAASVWLACQLGHVAHARGFRYLVVRSDTTLHDEPLEFVIEVGFLSSDSIEGEAEVLDVESLDLPESCPASGARRGSTSTRHGPRPSSEQPER